MSSPQRGALRRRWSAGRTPRRVWAFALFCALAGHLTVILLAGWLRGAAFGRSRLSLAPTVAVELVSDDSLGDRGGGSSVPGDDEEALGAAEPEPIQELVARAAHPVPIPEEPDEPEVTSPVPPVTEPEELDVSPSPFDSDADWFEQDVLLAQTDPSEDAFKVQVRGAFNSFIHRPKRVRPLAGSDVPQNSRYAGSGAGRYGGPGGLGSTPRVVGETFAFGGERGAFLGRMCFVPVGLRSLAALSACKTELTFRTDEINVAPRQFDRGFPGIPDRIEWFSILYTGTFTVTESGSYEFRLLSDDGSVLHIDGRPVVDNDGVHGPAAAKGSVHLDAGPHRFELWYFQGPRMLVALQLFVTPPGYGEGERLFSPKL